MLGPSGSGKSTLARALAGLLPHTLPGRWEGSLRLDRLEVAETATGRLAEVTGICFQDPEGQLVMSRVEDEVAFGLENRAWSRPRMLRRVPEALAEVGLGGFERRDTARISGGEQQRLAIADVLAPLPGLLVFDEPTAQLDPVGTEAVFERLERLARRRERTIVIVEHRVDAVLPIADRVLILDGEGRQVGFGRPDEVGQAHAETLDRIGGWVPSAWRGWLRTPVDDGPARTEHSRGEQLVACEDLWFSYPRDATDPRPPVLREVGFRLREGERVALVGSNGSGKSTLLLLVAGLLKQSRGRIVLAGGRDPRRLSRRELPHAIGLCFQDPELGFVAPTVREEVAAGLSRSAPGLQAGQVDDALRRFGLEGLAEESPFRLSIGEQRRLSICAATIRQPRLLLLDEPTFGLDRLGSDAVIELLDVHRSSGGAQLLATHDPRLVSRCDRVIALHAGAVRSDGPAAAFLADPPLRPQAPWRLASGSGRVPDLAPVAGR